MAEKTTLLIVDSSIPVVEGIRAVLAARPGLEVVGTARNAGDALRQVRCLLPDIVVMDISIPGMKVVQAVRSFQESDPKPDIVIFSMYSDREYVVSLFQAGISGYVLKEDDVDELAQAIETVRDGGRHLSTPVRRILRDHMADPKPGDGGNDPKTRVNTNRMSTREKQVFPLLADGLSAQEISDRLCMSLKIAETHMFNIMQKLGIESVAEIAEVTP